MSSFLHSQVTSEVIQVGKRKVKDSNDTQRKSQDGYSELLFRLVFQSNKRRLCLRPKSDVTASGEQD